jgi:hypothetical protein
VVSVFFVGIIHLALPVAFSGNEGEAVVGISQVNLVISIRKEERKAKKKKI